MMRSTQTTILSLLMVAACGDSSDDSETTVQPTGGSGPATEGTGSATDATSATSSPTTGPSTTPTTATTAPTTAPTTVDPSEGSASTAGGSTGTTEGLGVVQGIFTDGAWTTNFDYGQACNFGGNGEVDCADIENDFTDWGWGNQNNSIDGHYTEVTTAAANPDGNSNFGLRQWTAGGPNNQTSELRLDFSGSQNVVQAEPELWLRWYQRYEPGYKWVGGNPIYDKNFYIYTGVWADGSQGWVVTGPAGNGTYSFWIPSQFDYQVVSPVTWADVFGAVSDGSFHLFECHMKMDTDQTDGVGTIWIDGVRVAHETNVDYSGGDAFSRNGWTFIEFPHNQDNPDNGASAYNDYADIAIYNTAPPNTDSFGNPWIGPLSGA